jgi:hypothetical protein
MKTSKLTASHTEVSDTFSGAIPSKKRTSINKPTDFDDDELEIDPDDDLASLDELAADDEDDDF